MIHQGIAGNRADLPREGIIRVEIDPCLLGLMHWRNDVAPLPQRLRQAPRNRPDGVAETNRGPEGADSRGGHPGCGGCAGIRFCNYYPTTVELILRFPKSGGCPPGREIASFVNNNEQYAFRAVRHRPLAEFGGTNSAGPGGNRRWRGNDFRRQEDPQGPVRGERAGDAAGDGSR